MKLRPMHRKVYHLVLDCLAVTAVVTLLFAPLVKHLLAS